MEVCDTFDKSFLPVTTDLPYLLSAVYNSFLSAKKKEKKKKLKKISSLLEVDNLLKHKLEQGKQVCGMASINLPAALSSVKLCPLVICNVCVCWAARLLRAHQFKNNEFLFYCLFWNLFYHTLL